jgi:YidC/Oxa1 family membrane protein insertase
VDRNTIIALILVLLIWLAWPKWMELIYGEQPSEPAVPAASQIDSASAPSEIVVDDPVIDDVPELVASQALEAVPARDIEISTSLYHARISSRGAVLRGVQLREFVTAGGDPVELLSPDGYGMGMHIGPKGQEIDLSQSVFSVDARSDHLEVFDGDSVVVNFSCTLADGRTATKRMTFRGGLYSIGFRAAVRGGNEISRIALSWKGEVPPAEGDFQQELALLKAEAYVGDDLEDLTFSGSPETSAFVGITDWIGIRNKYFLTAFAPSTHQQSEVELHASGIPKVRTNLGWRVSSFDVTRTEMEGLVYVGPIDVDRLVLNGHNLERAADLGFTLIRPISKVVFWTFTAMHRVIPNYGVVIVLFTILVSVLLYPLTKKSFESTSKMQKLKPLIDELKEKYKDDSKKQQEETLKLYKEQGANPLGGCLPMVLQMPIIFAIYAVLGNNLEFRQAGFFAWISDLSAPDTLAILPFDIPFYGNKFNVLPILMAGSMFIQQKLTLTDPKQKMMVYMMPVILMFVFNRLSSGLVLYWFTYNVLTSARQYLLVKKQKSQDLVLADVGGTGPPRRSNKQKRRK